MVNSKQSNRWREGGGFDTTTNQKREASQKLMYFILFRSSIGRGEMMILRSQYSSLPEEERRVTWNDVLLSE